MRTRLYVAGDWVAEMNGIAPGRLTALNYERGYFEIDGERYKVKDLYDTALIQHGNDLCLIIGKDAGKQGKLELSTNKSEVGE